MTIQQLRYIWAVHEHKHFGRAAEVCNVSQASLSAMIRKFENEHNIILFDRSHQPIQTTSCGKDALEKIKIILHQLDDLSYYLGKAEHIMSGELRIGVIPTIASGLLPLVYQELEEHLPDIKFHFSILKTDEIWDQLKSEQIDAGIVATPPHNDLFQAYILYYESLKVYQSVKKEDLQFKLPVQMDDAQLWLLEEGHCLKSHAAKICQLEQLKRPYSNLQIASDSLDTLVHLVNMKGGYTILPELYIKLQPNELQAKVQSFESPIPVREISLVTWRDRTKFRLVKGLRETICRYIQPKVESASLQNKDMIVLDI